MFGWKGRPPDPSVPGHGKAQNVNRGLGIFLPGHSGFHLDLELASRDEGAPREGRTRGAAGGGSFLSTNRSQNLEILIFSGVTAISGL